MYVIGLTGGVGSGKSLVAEKLSGICDAELIIADEIAHVVMKSGTECFRKIVERFGTQIVAEDGEFDRKALAKIMFEDKAALEDMNSIVHPEVKEYIRKYIEERKAQKGIIVFETAIMYETGCDKLCDEVWYVHVPAVIRMERLKKSRGYSDEKSRSIMEQQYDDEFFMERADVMIENSGDIGELEYNIKQKLEISAKYMN